MKSVPSIVLAVPFLLAVGCGADDVANPAGSLDVLSAAQIDGGWMGYTVAQSRSTVLAAWAGTISTGSKVEYWVTLPAYNGSAPRTFTGASQSCTEFQRTVCSSGWARATYYQGIYSQQTLNCAFPPGPCRAPSQCSQPAQHGQPPYQRCHRLAVCVDLRGRAMRVLGHAAHHLYRHQYPIEPLARLSQPQRFRVRGVRHGPGSDDLVHRLLYAARRLLFVCSLLSSCPVGPLGQAAHQIGNLRRETRRLTLPRQSIPVNFLGSTLPVRPFWSTFSGLTPPC